MRDRIKTLATTRLVLRTATDAFSAQFRSPEATKKLTMKAQIVAFVAVCMLCALPLASAAATSQASSVGDTTIDGLQAIIDGAESAIETAVESANNTIVSVFEKALNSANSLVDNFVQSAINNVTGTASGTGIADLTSCTAVAQTFTNLTTQVKDGVLQCAESGLSPLAIAISDLQAIRTTLDDLLSQGKELYDSCGDFNFVCQLETVPKALAELAAIAVADGGKVALLTASLAVQVLGIDEAKILICAGTTAGKIVVDFGDSLVDTIRTCVKSLKD